MAFPKQVKPTLPLVPKKTLSARREQLLEYINEDGTYLPKSVLHADLDRGMLDFVKEDLKVVTAGKIVPMVDIIITTQNWTQYVETALFVDLDYNDDNIYQGNQIKSLEQNNDFLSNPGTKTIQSKNWDKIDEGNTDIKNNDIEDVNDPF